MLLIFSKDTPTKASVIQKNFIYGNRILHTLFPLFHLGKLTLGKALLRVDMDAKLDKGTSVLESSSFATGNPSFPLGSQTGGVDSRLCRQQRLRTWSVCTPLATLERRFSTP